MTLKGTTLTFGLVLAVVSGAFAQRGPRAMPDPVVDLGARLYATNCYHCHGDGNLVAGIDFRKGQFKRASTDARSRKRDPRGSAGNGNAAAFVLLIRDDGPDRVPAFYARFRRRNHRQCGRRVRRF